MKVYKSENYNQVFNPQTGFHSYWGKTLQDNPEYAPHPAILDMEIMSGYCRGNCKYCYKDNGLGKTFKCMSLDTFKALLSKMNLDILTQIAFGICDIQPLTHSMWDIFRYSKEKGIIPNFTTTGIGLTKDMAHVIKEICGAVAVSIISQESIEAVKLLLDTGMKQVNIHFVVHKDNSNEAFKIVKLAKDLGVNAVVFLKYKPKGNGKHQFSTITDLEFYKEIVDFAKYKGQPIGFDSCSANLYLASLTEMEREVQTMFVDPCESGLFSAYINVDGKYFPCSFAEGEEQGLDVLSYPTFTDLWNSNEVKEWRNKLLCNGRNCPLTFKE